MTSGPDDDAWVLTATGRWRHGPTVAGSPERLDSDHERPEGGDCQEWPGERADKDPDGFPSWCLRRKIPRRRLLGWDFCCPTAPGLQQLIEDVSRECGFEFNPVNATGLLC